MESPEPFVRMCPSCDRRVPKRFEECRCGFRLTDTETVIVGEALEPEEPREPSGSRQMLMVGAGLVLGLGLAALPLRSFLTSTETTARARHRARRRPRHAAPAAAPAASATAAPELAFHAAHGRRSRGERCADDGRHGQRLIVV